MKFNRLKFLTDVAEHENRCMTMSKKRAEAVQLRYELKRAEDRLKSLEYERSRLKPAKAFTALREDYDKTIADLQIDMANSLAWIMELEKGLESEAARNQAVGSLITSMRRLLLEHGVPDPSKTVVA